MRDRKLLVTEMGRVSKEEYRNLPDSGVVVVLDNIRSAHNVGSAFRSSDAFGVDKVCVCGISAVPPSAEIHKTAIGAEEAVPWEYFGKTLDALKRLREEGYTLVAVEQTVHSIKLGDFRPEAGKKYALVFGNEVSGVDQEAVDFCDFSLEIPQKGSKHSLNVAVSVGVVLWAVTSGV